MFQSASHDKGVSRANAQAFYDAASEPKQLIWYATGHEMKTVDVDRDRGKVRRLERICSNGRSV